MNSFKILSRAVINISKVPSRSCKNKPNPHRKSVCLECVYPRDKRECFNINNIVLARGDESHAESIKDFLYTHYWPREPSVVSLWMSLDSPYLEVLTEKYAYSGSRRLAYEKIYRTGECKLVGVSVVNKTFPWMADELEDWGNCTTSSPESHRMYFTAHCLRQPDLFNKYHVPYVYDVEIIATAAEITGMGVGKLLLKAALHDARELRYALVSVTAFSHYTAKICEACEMKLEWSMAYSDYVDRAGKKIFYSRRPHSTVSIYTKYFDPKEGAYTPCIIPKD